MRPIRILWHRVLSVQNQLGGRTRDEPLLPFEWCRGPDFGLPAPDIVFFFDITPEKAKERGGYDEERYEKKEIHLRVRKSFHRIAKEMLEDAKDARAIGKGATRWICIDAGRERSEVEQDVWKFVEPLIKQGIEGPVMKLWTPQLL